MVCKNQWKISRDPLKIKWHTHGACDHWSAPESIAIEAATDNAGGSHAAGNPTAETDSVAGHIGFEL
jgi:hypothetical protein